MKTKVEETIDITLPASPQIMFGDRKRVTTWEWRLIATGNGNGDCNDREWGVGIAMGSGLIVYIPRPSLIYLLYNVIHH